MSDVQAQYEAFPYPERDPRDEAKRLIVGSPSWPQEMDHWLWGGGRDWTQTTRILVAGGGTGDGLIQLAQTLTSARRPYEITYLDLSKAAREIAEARAQARGLTGITFVTDSLLAAEAYGQFDYIDCCGVLHHLPDPQAGFDALSKAPAPGGGIGLMVYAPHGRAGVYPLQAAFGRVTENLAATEKLAAAKAIFAKLPNGHPFRSNPHLVDHKDSDAGFYDLLLHSSDRPFTITELVGALHHADLDLAGVPEPALYDPSDLIGTACDVPLSVIEKMQLSEDLRGTLKVHVAYAARRGKGQKPPLSHPSAIPHLKGVRADQLAQSVAKSGTISLTSGGEKRRIDVGKSSAAIIAGINGRRSLGDIANNLKLDPIAFKSKWGTVEAALCGHGILHYSSLFKGL